MAFQILINESNASRRAVPIWLVGSDGTTPVTNASGATFMFHIGGAFYGSGGSLSVVSASAGEYVCAFADSKVSVLGPGVVMYQAAATLPASSPFEVVPVNSYDSMRMGLFALPNAAAEASGGLITLGTGAGQLHVSSGSVGLKAQLHSQVTIQGVTRVLNLSANDDKTGYEISGTKTTLDDLNDIDGSGVTLHAGTHSNVTIKGIQNYANISNVTLHEGVHSGASVEIAAGGIQAASLGAGTITAAKFAASAIDAAALATDAGQEIADRVLSRNIETGSDTGRLVRHALAPLRNRVLIEGSTGTVFQADDSTSLFTFSVVTGTHPIHSVDPQT